MRSTVAVIIPCYNAEKTICRALGSILAQTYKPTEVLVINDGSTDSTAASVNQWIRENQPPYVIKLISQDNKGPSAARNRGIVTANCEYIAFLDSDDFWLPNHLNVGMSVLLDNSNENIVVSSSPLVNGKLIQQKTKNGIKFRNISFYFMLFLQRGFCTPGTIAKKEDIIEAGLFPESRRYAEDLELFLKLRGKVSRWLTISSPQTVVCDKHLWASGAGLSSNHWEMYNGTVIAALNALKLSSIPSYLLEPVIRTYFFGKYLRRLVYLSAKGAYQGIFHRPSTGGVDP